MTPRVQRSFLKHAHRSWSPTENTLTAEAGQGAESAAAKERMQNTPATHLIASRGVWHTGQGCIPRQRVWPWPVDLTKVGPMEVTDCLARHTHK